MSGSSPVHVSGVGVGIGIGIGIGIGGGNASSTTIPAAVLFGGGSDDNSAFQFPTDLISAQDHKDEALLVLKTELMASLQKEVKSLDEDSWKFAGPRSQIHLISRPGGLLHNQTETAKQWHSGDVLHNQTETAKQWHSGQLK